ncbi:hypothetical protein MCOR02_010435 [Pyricularia oryzae]|nr:hypothetical protein MCOR02_010435 [Pyricularia oryzae]KAI6315348.1 hypothetical protein MCOR34_004685 [Pyricularia oryzae]KAI6468853.1 hypothetical protein MCOR17_003956 [Pyricularia oryzae]KAI6510923.1 hypothetical protein MCOR13_000847 [Pyricularia oryzae]KAI6596655.1 hypothetical protein MCOR04_002907 [Pyricularia oryzae]
MAPTTPFYGLDSDGDDEMALLEETFKETSVPYDEEVEVFAKYLDDCTLESGSTQQKLAKIFRLVEQYSDYVNERAQALRERLRLASTARHGKPSWQNTSDDNTGQGSGATREGVLSQSERLQLWEQEAQTWDLLRRILPLRYGQKPSTNSQQHGPHWNEFLETVEGAAENKAVLEWLQMSARVRPDIDDLVKDLQQNADRGDILAHGWLHTKTAIKMYKTHMHMAGTVDTQTADSTGSNLKSANGPMVTQLDPDVVIRQKRKLAAQDEYFERAIWLGCFELLRRGRSMSEIRDWCQERTEAWRAVSISGLPLALDGRGETSIDDPTSILLWRRMCLQMARNGGTDDFERGVYGILAGDREKVEAVSRTWDDFVFAQYNAQLRGQYDQYLVEKCGLGPSSPLNQFGAVELPRSGHSSKSYVDGLVLRPTINSEAKSVSRTLHSSILSNGLDDFLIRQGDMLALESRSNSKQNELMSRLLPSQDVHFSASSVVGGFANLSDHQWIRTMSHIFIAISELESITKPDQAPDRRLPTKEHILVSYIGYLRLAGLDELIPLYCAKLQGERRYICMSRNLIHITDRELQVRLLSLMSKMGHNMVDFVNIQPQLYLDDISEAVEDSPLLHTERHAIQILAAGPPSLKYGRVINPGVLGNNPTDPEDTEFTLPDEYLIRSMEWMLLVTGLLPETFEYGVRIYKYFFKHKRLVAARALAERVSCAEILRLKANLAIPDEEESIAWWDDVFSPANLEPAIDAMDEDDVTPEVSREQLSIIARPYYELESAIKVMDCLETTAHVVHQTRDDGSRDREAAKSLADNAKLIKNYMKPLLKDWLLTSKNYRKEFIQLREMYLPELVMGYASALHAAGTSSTRDYLLECMDLAAQIAAEGSDLAELLVKTGRMKELLESFASCSKALAIWTTDLKKGQGPNSKKYRETGWSRELWTIKP